MVTTTIQLGLAESWTVFGDARTALAIFKREAMWMRLAYSVVHMAARRAFRAS